MQKGRFYELWSAWNSSETHSVWNRSSHACNRQKVCWWVRNMNRKEQSALIKRWGHWLQDPKTRVTTLGGGIYLLRSSGRMRLKRLLWSERQKQPVFMRGAKTVIWSWIKRPLCVEGVVNADVTWDVYLSPFTYARRCKAKHREKDEWPFNRPRDPNRCLRGKANKFLGSNTIVTTERSNNRIYKEDKYAAHLSGIQGCETEEVPSHKFDE